MTQHEPRRRLWLFLTATLVITGGAWGALVPLARSGVLRFGQPVFMTLYMLGGLGPTIAAYLAVLASRDEAPVREFHSRLFRWRVGAIWYLVAIGLPFAMALASVGLAGLLEPAFLDRLTLQPWYRLFPLFVGMIVGGGLEELGWRGVAQPELERRMSRIMAASLIGVVWAAWHFPLFWIPGVGQYGTSFPIFTVHVIGLAFILAWLYGHTRSILLCVVFHAAANTALAMGLKIPPELQGSALAEAALQVLVGVGLVVASRVRQAASG